MRSKSPGISAAGINSNERLVSSDALARSRALVIARGSTS